MLRLVLAKELRLLLREPSVRLAVVMPFVIYVMMGFIMGGAAEQVREAARMEGLSIAIAADPDVCSTARVIATLISLQGANTTVACGANPLELLTVHPVVLKLVSGFSWTEGGVVEVYVRASLSELLKGLAIPTTLSESLAGLPNVTFRGYLLIADRLWNLEQLQAIFNTGLWLGYAAVIVAFPAAGIAAAVVGAEREERVLETMLSLPIRRRDLALAKVVAVLAVAAMIAVSAMAGIHVMVEVGSGRPAAIAVSEYGITGLALYGLALFGVSLMIASLSMLLGLFAGSYRGAQAIAGIPALPLLVAAFMVFMGLSENPATAALPYIGLAYAAYTPLVGTTTAAIGALSQVLYALAILALLAKVLESELAVSGPETLKQVVSRLLRRSR
jgi:ABC-2 type transport system permease protein